MREVLQYTVQYVGDFSRIRQEAQKLTEQSNRGTAGVNAVADAALGKARALKQEILGADVALNRMYASWQRMQKGQTQFAQSTILATNVGYKNPSTPPVKGSSKQARYALSPELADKMRWRSIREHGFDVVASVAGLMLDVASWAAALTNPLTTAAKIATAGSTAVNAYSFSSAMSRMKGGFDLADFLSDYGQRQTKVQKWLGLTDEQTSSLWMDDVRDALNKKGYLAYFNRFPLEKLVKTGEYKQKLLGKIAYNESVGRWETGRMYPSLQQPEPPTLESIHDQQAAAYQAWYEQAKQSGVRTLSESYDRYEEYYRGINNLATESAEQIKGTQTSSAEVLFQIVKGYYDAAKEKSSESTQHQKNQILLASNSAVQAYQILGQAQAQVSTKMVEDWDQAALDIEGGFAELGDMQIDVTEDVSKKQIETAKKTQQEMTDLAKTGVRERQAIEQGFIATWTRAWNKGYSALNDMIYGFMMGQKDVWSNFAQSLKSIFFNALSSSITDVIKSWTSSLFSGLANALGKGFARWRSSRSPKRTKRRGRDWGGGVFYSRPLTI